MWQPPPELLNNENFILDDLPHGCDACQSRHNMHTPDWDGCRCIYCVQHENNPHEKDMRKIFQNWKSKGEPISFPSGSCGVYTQPCPVDVLVAREFGLFFKKDSDMVVKRDWSEYTHVKIVNWKTRDEHVEKKEQLLQKDDDWIRYILIKL